MAGLKARLLVLKVEALRLGPLLLKGMSKATKIEISTKAVMGQEEP